MLKTSSKNDQMGQHPSVGHQHQVCLKAALSLKAFCPPGGLTFILMPLEWVCITAHPTSRRKFDRHPYSPCKLRMTVKKVRTIQLSNSLVLCWGYPGNHKP
jgi:hypothetical protein